MQLIVLIVTLYSQLWLCINSDLDHKKQLRGSLALDVLEVRLICLLSKKICLLHEKKSKEICLLNEKKSKEICLFHEKKSKEICLLHKKKSKEIKLGDE